jgi:DNA-binding MarR family transcriptional regulator
MSVKIMSLVWDATDISPTEKLMLLSLADHANDEGVCYPSAARLAKKTSLSERSVRSCVKRLSDAGWLVVSRNSGPRGCNVFTITRPLQELHPAGAAPLQEVPEGVQEVPFTPAGAAPEPSENHQEPSFIKRASVRDILCHVAGSEAVDSFIAYRKKTKAKALTETAAKRLAKQLTKIFEGGGDTDDALGMAEERGWQTVQSDWYFNSRAQRNGQSPSTSNAARFQQGSGNGQRASIASIIAGDRSASGW